MLGFFPFIAAFLSELGEPRLSIAGAVIAGFAIGGLVLHHERSRLLPRLGVKRHDDPGAAWSGCSWPSWRFGLVWKLQALSLLFMDWGFFMIHGSLQVFAREFGASPRHRAVAARVFLFLGQTVGPIAYGLASRISAKSRPCWHSRP